MPVSKQIKDSRLKALYVLEDFHIEKNRTLVWR